jgi:hypothetical protein
MREAEARLFAAEGAKVIVADILASDWKNGYLRGCGLSSPARMRRPPFRHRAQWRFTLFVPGRAL